MSRKPLEKVTRTPAGWQSAAGRVVSDENLLDRENNILQFAVARLCRYRPSWTKRHGVPRKLSLRNLARLELTD